MKTLNILFILALTILGSCAKKGSSGSGSSGGGTTTTPTVTECKLNNAVGNGLTTVANVTSVYGNVPYCYVSTCATSYKILNNQCVLSGNVPSNLFYNAINSFTFYVDQNISIITAPSISDCSAADNCQFSIASGGALPVGISLNPLTGALTGLPTSPKTQTYYIKATNNNGSIVSNIPLNIKVLYRPVSGLSINSISSTYRQGLSIASNIINASSGNNTIGTIVSTPALPTGLSLQKISIDQWAITGSPTVISPLTTYSLKATGQDGLSTETLTVQIEVSTPPTSLSYSTTNECSGPTDGYLVCNFILGTPITDIIPTYNGSNVKFRVVPSPTNQTLPNGISLSPSSGKIVSASLGAMSTDCGNGGNQECLYKIEAYNDLGSVSYLMKMKIRPPGGPSSFNYPSTAYSFRVLTSITPSINPLFPNGLVNCISQSTTCFTSSPPMPTGIILSGTTGEISGMPEKSAKQLVTTYVITGHDTRGNVYSQPITIEVKERLPVFTYAASASYSMKKTVAVETTGMPTIDTSGGFANTPSCGTDAIPITSFSVSPALPSGLTLNTGAFQCGVITSGGSITGTPTQNSSATTYTITGCNDGGCGTSTIQIDVSPSFLNLSGGLAHACTMVQDTAQANQHNTPTTANPAQVMCWGANDKKQLAETTSESCTQSEACVKKGHYIKVSGSNLTNVLAIASGKNHSCSIVKINDAVETPPTSAANGQIYCWGDNSLGQVGSGSGTANISSPELVLNATTNNPITTAYQVASGGDNTCALIKEDREGSIYCWGKNYGPKAVKVVINSSDTIYSYPAITLGLGENHACVVAKKFDIDDESPVAGGDRAYCWGQNEYGQLGNNSTSLVYNLTPSVVLDSSLSQLTNVSSITLGGNHSCSYLNDTNLKCWGDNQFGQVKGLATTSPSYFSTAQSVNAAGGAGVITNPSKISASFNTTYITYTNSQSFDFIGKLPLFGAPYTEELSNNPSSILFGYGSPTNYPFNGSSSMKAPSSKDFYCDVLTKNSNIYCWGKNNKGQLGNNTLIDSVQPSRLILDYN